MHMIQHNLKFNPLIKNLKKLLKKNGNMTLKSLTINLI
jgi:2-polyprenyl-3-methyl-5-hydroxy-6-metoxy-1,4-benzoquinol methylase